MNGTLNDLKTWDQIHWSSVETQIRNLKYRIFMATQSGNRIQLRRL